MFIILIFFLVSFAVVHFYSMNFTKYLYVEGYHIHHFYFGTACLALGGILGTLTCSLRKKKIAFALIGIGLGLFGDEIGLLLNCTSVGKTCAYYFPAWDDIILIITAIIVFLIAIADSEIVWHTKLIEKIFKKTR